MISLKSGKAVEGMRAACQVAAQVLAEVRAIVAVGITTFDLEQAARTAISSRGAKSACFGYRIGRLVYPAHICVSVNEEVVHGIPSVRRKLRDGDIVSLDVVIVYDGYIGDNATTVPVGAVSTEVRRLLTVTEEALHRGIASARVGGRVGDISSAIQTHVEANGFGVVREMVGHGVGTEMHEEPQVPNFGRRGTGELIRAGMTLAIEPMVTLGSHRTKVLQDGWTVSTADGKPAAHFEHTVLIKDEGPEILTKI